jgi:hypothetical protein
MRSVKRLDGQRTFYVKVVENGNVVRDRAAVYHSRGGYFIRSNGEYRPIVSPAEISDATETVYI